MRKKSTYFLLIAMMLMSMLFIGTLTVASAGFSQLPNTTASDPVTTVLDCGPNDMSYIPVNASATALWFWAGPCSDTTYGGCGDDYFNSGEIPIATFSGTQTFTGLPGDGSIVWFTAFEKVSGIWVFGDQTSDTAATGCLVGCGDSGEYCGGGSPDGCFCDDACVDLGDCCEGVNPYIPVCDGGTPMITGPPDGSELTCGANTVTWTNNGAGVSQWYLWAGPCNNAVFGGCGDDYYNSGPLPPGQMSATIPAGALPDNSTVYVRLWFNIGGAWNSVVNTYTTPICSSCIFPGDVPDCNGNCYPAWYEGDGICDAGPSPFPDFMCPAFNFDGGDCSPMITGPPDGSELTCEPNTVTWTNNGAGVSQWYLWAGPCNNAVFGGCGDDYYNSGPLSGATMSATIPAGALPDNSTVYVRLWFNIGGAWNSVVNTYTTPTCSSCIFPGDVPDCNGNCYPASYEGDGICDDGPSPFPDFMCPAFNFDGGDCSPMITSPFDGSELTCEPNTVTWTNNGAGVSQWYLWAGPCNNAVFGGCGDDYYNSGPLSGATMSATIPAGALPDNSTVYVRLWFNIGGAWNSVVNTYTTPTCSSCIFPGDVPDCNGNCYPAWYEGDGICDDGPSPGPDFMCPAFNFDGGDCGGPEITSPPPGSVLCGDFVTFNWTNNGVPVTQYWIWIGNTGVGSNNYYSESQGTNTSVELSGWPADGSQIYLRLFYTTSGSPSWPADWNSVDYQYIDGAC